VSIRALLILFACSLHLTLCDTHAEEKPLVIASVPPIAMLIEEIAGDAVEVHTLITGSVDPHLYEPKPSDIEKVSKAVLLVGNGGGYEFWARTIPESRRIEMSDKGSPSRPGPVQALWTDPVRVITFLPRLRDRLCAIPLDRCSEIGVRMDRLIEKLRSIDEEIRTAARTWSRRVFFVSHEVWGPFADRYGLSQEGGLAECDDRLTPRDMEHLFKIVRDHKIGYILVEPLSQSGLPPSYQGILHDLGLTPRELDSLGLTARSYPDFLVRTLHQFRAVMQ
jgi:ABC-type Zn uptake system ZnuABC Zn-binding protein ZnuA